MSLPSAGKKPAGAKPTGIVIALDDDGAQGAGRDAADKGVSRNTDMEKTETETVGQYLSFTMGDEAYAFPVTCVREVLVVPRVTRIPRMPDFMRGVINLRGAGRADSRSQAAVSTWARPSLGYLRRSSLSRFRRPRATECCTSAYYADSVNKVITLGSGDIEPAPSLGMRVLIPSSFWVWAALAIRSRLLLDAGEILSDEDIELAEAVRDGAIE